MRGRQSSQDARIRALLSQVARLRSRINRQLVEEVAFGVLALLIAVAALGVLAALWLSAPKFAALCGIAIVLTGAALTYAVVHSVRSWTNLKGAAGAADKRAGLKHRLTTLLTAEQAARDSSLWLFLVEDALDLRERFLPAKVAPWRVPRALFALLLACLLAALAAFGVKRERIQTRAALALKAPPTLPEMSTMPEMGALAEAGKLAPNTPGEQDGGDQSSAERGAQAVTGAPPLNEQPKAAENLWSKLSQRADQLAQALQDDIAGRKHQGNTRALEQSTAREAQPDSEAPSNGHGPNATQQTQAGRTHDKQSGATVGDNGSARAEGQDQAAAAGPNGGQPTARARNDAHKGGPISSGPQALSGREMTYGQVGDGRGGEREKSDRPSTGGGHGLGSDPDHLFGRAEAPSSSSRTFKITMQGNMSNSQVQAGGQAYRPPRADVALNPHQEPDQPMYRPQVAPTDREAIKRVFGP